MGILQYFIYLSILAMIAGICYRVVRIARMPIHLRWELYPIPNNRKKSKYGGSYFEEVDWWNKSEDHSLLFQILATGKEIFFIKTLYYRNRSLWIFSFPFHLGMYIFSALVVLLIVGALMSANGVMINLHSPNAFEGVIYSLSITFAVTGCLLGSIGAAGLIAKRIFVIELRSSSVWTNYFNLFLLLMIFICFFVGWATADRSLDLLRGYTANLIYFQPTSDLPSALKVGVALASLFCLYLPFTQMSHFLGKYFTFHRVLWDDRKNTRGSKIEKSAAVTLDYKFTWSAPHIKPGNRWSDMAKDTGEPEIK